MFKNVLLDSYWEVLEDSKNWPIFFLYCNLTDLPLVLFLEKNMHVPGGGGGSGARP